MRNSILYNLPQRCFVMCFPIGANLYHIMPPCTTRGLYDKALIGKAYIISI